MQIDQPLKYWIMLEVREETDHDGTLRRRDVIRDVLVRYARLGDAERYVRKDGTVAWRASDKFRDYLSEAAQDAQDLEDAVQ